MAGSAVRRPQRDGNVRLHASSVHLHWHTAALLFSRRDSCACSSLTRHVCRPVADRDLGGAGLGGKLSQTLGDFTAITEL